MAQELLYTSAPRGLKTGSRGFCTVEATSGMSPALMSALEALSGYRHVAPPGDSANPVVYSHVTLSLGGRHKSVVSRIADAGTDYSGRTNKIAYHLALDPAERAVGGPAWLSGRADVMKIAFAGEPQALAPRIPPKGDRPLVICTAWKAATGDAGWAGALAEAFLADPNRPAYLVVPPNLDVRTLFEEAIALLPPDRRWGATFTTLYTSLPQNVTCQWRAVLAGSKEAHESRRFVQALRLDLTSSLGAATGGALVEAARTGRVAKAPPPVLKREKATSPAIASTTAAVDEDIPLDVMPRKDSPRPERLIEPLMAPPEMRRRSAIRKAAWIAAGVVCFGVLVAPIAVGVTAHMRNAKKTIAAKREDNARPSNVASTDSSETEAATNTVSATVGGDIISSSADDVPLERSPPKPPVGMQQTEQVTSSEVDGTTDVSAAPTPAADEGHTTAATTSAKPATGSRDFEMLRLKPSANTSDTYLADQSLPAGGQHNLAIYLVETAIGELKAENQSGELKQLTISRKDAFGRYSSICTITIRHDDSDQYRLEVHGAEKDLERVLPLIALETSNSAPSENGTKRYLPSLWTSKPPRLPRRFENRKLSLQVPGDNSLLLEALQVLHVKISWAGRVYDFAREEAATPPSFWLESDAVAELLRTNVRVDDLLSYILEHPPRIKVERDGDKSAWNVSLEQGELWSGLPGQLSTSLLGKKLAFSKCLGVSDPENITKALLFPAVVHGDNDANVKELTMRFEKAAVSSEKAIINIEKQIEGVKSKEEKELAQTMLKEEHDKLTEIERRRAEYEDYIATAQFVARTDRGAFFAASIEDIEVFYRVVKGEKTLQVPLMIAFED